LSDLSEEKQQITEPIKKAMTTENTLQTSSMNINLRRQSEIIVTIAGVLIMREKNSPPYIIYKFQFQIDENFHIFSARYSQLLELHHQLVSSGIMKNAFKKVPELKKVEFPPKMLFVDMTRKHNWKLRAKALKNYLQSLCLNPKILYCEMFQNGIQLTTKLKKTVSDIAIDLDNKRKSLKGHKIKKRSTSATANNTSSKDINTDTIHAGSNSNIETDKVTAFDSSTKCVEKLKNNIFNNDCNTKNDSILNKKRKIINNIIIEEETKNIPINSSDDATSDIDNKNNDNDSNYKNGNNKNSDVSNTSLLKNKEMELLL